MRLHARQLAAFSALATCLFASALGTRVVDHRRGDLGRRTRQPREEDDSLVRPFRFDQKLLVCNAYPSASRMEVRQNGKALADGRNAISFNECRYLATRVKSRDKLDLILQSQGMHGTFEVGELPTTDAVLLLVPERHPGSAVMNFQSFAFSTNVNNKDAQLAVINTFKGNDTAPHLQVEDHITGKEEQTVSKRIEQLNFDRVYSVEEGAYDALVADRRTSEGPPHQGARKLLKLRKNRNYVVLRTGDERGQFPESLVVFPETALHSGSRSRASFGLLLLASVFAAAGIQ